MSSDSSYKWDNTQQSSKVFLLDHHNCGLTDSNPSGKSMSSKDPPHEYEMLLRIASRVHLCTLVSFLFENSNLHTEQSSHRSITSTFSHAVYWGNMQLFSSYIILLCLCRDGQSFSDISFCIASSNGNNVLDQMN